MGEVVKFDSFASDTPIVVQTSAGALSLTVSALKQWCAPEASDSDCLRLAMVCRAAGLNPFLKEAYLVSFGGSWEVIISKNGWLKRAHSQADYRGHENGIIAQAFNPQTKERGEIKRFRGTFLPPGFIVVGGWAKVWRQGFDKPFLSTVSLTEYAKPTKAWREMTCTMIAKVALVHAIGEAFGLRDAFDEGEAPAPPQRPSATLDAVVEEPTQTIPSPASNIVAAVQAELDADAARLQEVYRDILEMKRLLGASEAVWLASLQKRGAERLEDLDFTSATQLLWSMRRNHDSTRLPGEDSPSAAVPLILPPIPDHQPHTTIPSGMRRK